MGFGGARDRALGRFAVIGRWAGGDGRADVSRYLRGAALASMSVTLLGGCVAIGGFVGAAAGIATSVATGNPGIALSVGIAVQAGTNEVLRTFSRRRQHSEHEAIASLVGDMNPGDTREWRHAHMIGNGSDHGEVRVVRVIDTPLAPCKELLFSYVIGEGEKTTRAWFTTTACKHEGRWRWAAAEPAVERWGNLQ
jgi:hypothetical protein